MLGGVDSTLTAKTATETGQKKAPTEKDDGAVGDDSSSAVDSTEDNDAADNADVDVETDADRARDVMSTVIQTNKTIIWTVYII